MFFFCVQSFLNEIIFNLHNCRTLTCFSTVHSISSFRRSNHLSRIYRVGTYPSLFVSVWYLTANWSQLSWSLFSFSTCLVVLVTIKPLETDKWAGQWSRFFTVLHGPLSLKMEILKRALSFDLRVWLSKRKDYETDYPVRTTVRLCRLCIKTWKRHIAPNRPLRWKKKSGLHSPGVWIYINSATTKKWCTGLAGK